MNEQVFHSSSIFVLFVFHMSLSFQHLYFVASSLGFFVFQLQSYTATSTPTYTNLFRFNSICSYGTCMRPGGCCLIVLLCCCALVTVLCIWHRGKNTQIDGYSVVENKRVSKFKLFASNLRLYAFGIFHIFVMILIYIWSHQWNKFQCLVL